MLMKYGVDPGQLASLCQGFFFCVLRGRISASPMEFRCLKKSCFFKRLGFLNEMKFEGMTF